MPCGHARTADVPRVLPQPIPPWAGPGSETGAMKGTLTQNGTETEATTENVLAALAGKQFFWLDLDDDASARHGEGTAQRPFRLPPARRGGSRKVQTAPSFRRLRQLRLPRRPRRRPDGQRAGRGALLLDRHLHRHRPPRRLPLGAGRARPDRPAQALGHRCGTPARHRLPDHQRVGGRLLSGPQRLRREDRLPRRRHPPGTHRSAAR